MCGSGDSYSIAPRDAVKTLGTHRSPAVTGEGSGGGVSLTEVRRMQRDWTRQCSPWFLVLVTFADRVELLSQSWSGITFSSAPSVPS